MFSLSASQLSSSIRLPMNFHPRNLQRSFCGKSSSARICSYLLCLQFCVIWMGNCLWFTDGKHCFTDNESTQHPLMNNTWKYALVIGGKVYLAWKRKMLHDIIGGHQVYIQRNRDLFIYLWGLEFRSWLTPRAVSRLRAGFARNKIIIKSLRSWRFATSFAQNYAF